MSDWRCGKCDGEDVHDHSLRCKVYPQFWQKCVLCGEPFGCLVLAYHEGRGWSHWHCDMNQRGDHLRLQPMFPNADKPE
jgi:hypothetical protein